MSEEISFEDIVDTCEGFDILLLNNEGDLVVEIIEGTAPFSYAWSNEATTASITPEEDGVYSVTITDAEGCTISEEITFEITDLCVGFSGSISESNGTLTGEASGGTAPYIFMWSTEESTPAITPSESGEYTLTIVDVEGCTIIESITIDIVDECEEFNANILHDGEGELTVEITAGTPPYLFEWSTGNNTNGVTVTVDGLYSLTITDAFGCIIVDEIDVLIDSGCDNILNLNADNTNTPIIFSAQSDAYLWKEDCSDIAPFTIYDHYYLLVDVTWDSWGTGNDINFEDIADGIPGISFGSNGIPQVGETYSPYLETDDYFYSVSAGANYDLDEVLITITETSNELGGQIAGTISGVIASQNNASDSSTVTGSFCVTIGSVCE